MLLVLEDLHWADALDVAADASSRALRRRGTNADRRDVSGRRGECQPTSPTHSSTSTAPRASPVSGSTGLSDDEIEEFVRLTTQVDPAPELTATVRELTGGNAFLVTELWRELMEAGADRDEPRHARLARPATDLGAPTTVREVVNQRLAAAHAAATNERARARGRHRPRVRARAPFDGRRRRIRRRAPRRGRRGRALSGLLVEEPGRGLAYRFEHELVRRAVDDGCRRPAKAETHCASPRRWRAGCSASDSRARLAALAHHYAAGAAVGGAGAAVEYNLLAAESAAAALAFEDAADRFRTALELGIRGARERAEVMLGLGDACASRGRRRARPSTRSRRSAELARDARRHGATRPRRRSGSRRPAGARRSTTAARSSCSRRRSRRFRPGRLGASRRACSAGSRGPSSSVATRCRAAVARDESIAMSRRRGRPPSLGATLAHGLLVARKLDATRRSTRCSRRRVELGAELGDVEIEGEALSWLVPSPSSSATTTRPATRCAELLCRRPAAEPAVPAPRRRALRGSARALRRRSRGGRECGAMRS